MTTSIPVNIIEDWITELQAILKADIREGKTGTDLTLNQGVRHGLDQVQHRITT